MTDEKFTAQSSAWSSTVLYNVRMGDTMTERTFEKSTYPWIGNPSPTLPRLNQSLTGSGDPLRRELENS
jgi:hypothetical protein